MRTRPTIWNFIKVNFVGQRIQNLNTDLVYIDKHTGEKCIEINARINRLIGELLLVIIPITLYLAFSFTSHLFNWDKIMDIILFTYCFLLVAIDILRLPFVKFKQIENFDEATGSGYKIYESILLAASAIGMVYLMYYVDIAMIKQGMF